MDSLRFALSNPASRRTVLCGVSTNLTIHYCSLSVVVGVGDEW